MVSNRFSFHQRYSKSRKVHLIMMGGLGNQLFQLAAGLHIICRLDRDVRFSTHWFNPIGKAKSSTEISRKFMIDELIHPEEKSSLPYITIKIRVLIGRFIKNYWVSELDLNQGIEKILSPSTNVLTGYFQDIRYVNSVQKQLVERLKNSRKFQQLIPERLEPRVAIHLRFGDYMDNESARRVHGLTGIKYYVEAARILLKETGCKSIVLVSDNPTLARECFSEYCDWGDTEILDSEGSSDLDDLAILSHSAGIVMSNSTFSWWAAWLGSTTLGAKVVMPNPWFAKASAADVALADLSWTILSREITV